MSSKDFFKKIDAELSEKKQEEEKEASDKEKRIEFFTQVVSRINILAEEYKDGLIARGITAKVNSSPRGIIFEMKFNDGGQHDLSLNESPTFDGYFSFTSHLTDDNGRRFTSTQGGVYTEKNWDDDLYRSSLEKHINDYYFYSKRHNGMR